MEFDGTVVEPEMRIWADVIGSGGLDEMQKSIALVTFHVIVDMILPPINEYVTRS